MAISKAEKLENEEKLLHELQFRDRVKSAEYHYATNFEFDGFFEDALIRVVFDKIKELAKEVDFSSFKLGVSWPEVSEDEKAHLKFSIQTPLIRLIESELKKKADFTTADAWFLVDFQKKLACIKMAPVFIRGRYCKYSREIAQTEFFCNKCRGKGCWYCHDTGHFSEESVEQLIGRVALPFFGAKLLILHGAGREDMDVLMLGNGRPFVAELLMPFKRFADLKKIEEEINSQFKGKISVNSLEFCLAKDVSTLKDAFHDKVYAAYVTSDKEIDFSKIPVGKKMAVAQKTPLRVSKRRGDIERKKEVLIQRVDKVSETEFVLVMRTSHGTYVKEFISGDGGRTKPSISSTVGAHCICKILDVLEVCD